MQTSRRPLATLMAVCSLVAGLASVVPTAHAADGNPPNKMTYQGFLVGADGAKLGSPQPANYTVVFKIYDAASAGNVIWAENQVVTVDAGYFSVLLGAGSVEGTFKHDDLRQTFSGATASDRYIGITVRIPGKPEVEITPRLQLVTSPYTFLARQANTIVDSAGTALITSVAGTVNITSLSVANTLTAGSFSGNGAALTALNAANIATGTLNADRIPGLDASKIATGSLPDARLSANIDRLDTAQTFTAAKTFTQPVTVNTTLTANSPITAPSFVGNGTIPIGGIIMWSGANVPAGWALCNGANGTPNLQDRFIVGSSGTKPPGNTGGSASVTLATANLPAHNHTYDDGVYLEQSGSVSGVNNGWRTSSVTTGIGSGDTDRDNDTLVYRPGLATSSTGSGTAFSIVPSYYALAFIMRIQ